MRIMFFLINMNLGGTEKSLLNLLDHLPNGCNVDLLLLENKGMLLNKIPANVRLLILENHEIINEYIKLGSRQFGFKQLKSGKLGLFLKCEIQFVLDKLKWIKNPYWAIHSYIKEPRENYDISIAYAGIHSFLAYYTLEKTQARKKILWIHFDIDKVVSDFFFGKRYYHFFNQIFCVSENASTAFRNQFLKASNKVFTFNNIINSNSLLEQAEVGAGYEDDFDGLRILTLGRLSEEKGQLMIPEIVKCLKEEKFKFRWYLIGDGKLFASLTENIKALAIEDELILLGSRINPYRYLRDCGLYVQTSFHEGEGMALREAKVFTRPIVTTDFLSAPNLIVHNGDGLIVEISVKGIYKGVKMLLENEELRNEFSKFSVPEVAFEKNIERFLSLK